MTLEEISESAANIEAATSIVATTFFDNAVKYGVGKYPKGDIRKSRRWPTFVKIAKKCMAGDVPADKFVTAAFKDALSRHCLVTVTDILNFSIDKMKGSEQSSSSVSPKDMWNLLSCKLLDTLFSVSGVTSREEILGDSMFGFPAWFRVFAPEHPVQRLLVNWGDIAFEEMRGNEALNEFLKTERPATYNLLVSVIKVIKGV